MRWSWIILILVLLSACAAHRQLKPIKKVPIASVLEGIASHQKEYTFFSAKGRVRFNGSEFKIGGRCNIRMIKDSLIWMNFKKVSIEGARVLITQDSFKIIYSYENYYEIGTFQAFLEEYHINFTFSELQDFIVGNVIIPSIDDILSFRTDTHHLIAFDHKDRHFKYHINENYSLDQLYVKDNEKRSLLASNSGFDEHLFAKNRKMNITTPEEGSFLIEIDLSSDEFDKPKKIKFEIPDHYREL